MDSNNKQLFKDLIANINGKEGFEGDLSALNVLSEANLCEFTPQAREVLAAKILQLKGKVLGRRLNQPIIHIDHGQALMRDSHVTDIFILSQDVPFIVDSIQMLLKKQGYRIQHMINAVQINPQSFGVDDEHEMAFLWFELDWFGEEEDFDCLKNLVENVLHDVHQAVRDWRKMQDSLRSVVNTWRHHQIKNEKGAENFSEILSFIDWLVEYFTFIGARSYRLDKTKQEPILHLIENSGLGVLSDEPHSFIKQYVQDLPSQLQHNEGEMGYFYLSKTRTASTIHRPTYTDLIVLRRFNEEGVIVGELRVIGLFTSDAYDSDPTKIPLIRKKVEGILAESDLKSRFLNKSLLYIIKTFPREELFQASFSDLERMTLGALSLYDRPKVRVFVRQDIMHHFFSVVLFLPRDRFTTGTVSRVSRYLCQCFNGDQIIYQPFFSESNLARIYFVIQPSGLEEVTFDERAIEKHIEELTTGWDDFFLEALYEVYDQNTAKSLYGKYKAAFSVGFRDRYAPKIAVKDIRYIENIAEHEGVGIAVYEPPNQPTALGIKFFQKNSESIELSDVFPILADMGLRIIKESTSEIVFENEVVYVSDLHCRPASKSLVFEQDEIEDYLKAYLYAILSQQTESDGFGGLAISAKFTPRKIDLLRTYARYLKQIRFPLEQQTIAQTFAAYPSIAMKLYMLFHARLHPQENSQQAYDRLKESITTSLDDIPKADHDRIIRTYMLLISKTVRTNYFLKDDGPIVIKLLTREIPDAPQPAPLFEAFVYGCELEGVHLRYAKVARGGLRWSNRRDDFRTEILGLMKAQQVKNSIIVPAGAKGGFIAKLIKMDDKPEVVAEKGRAAYQKFIHALLDITDNLEDEKVVPPQGVLRRDEDDPYFVVAADKGTATFSDIANGIAQGRNFWLGDAFASGGSNGYDHKKMGITAKGAWESVKWHAMCLGIDMDHEAITAVGIGDMAGDVFGNGMLLSKNIKLLAAFNHRHIFLDPNPDPKRSFEERQRLFVLPRSNWSDYREEVLSAGGGIFSRSQKKIQVSPQVVEALGLNGSTFTPNELIQAILKSPVDLLWNGGIGTYVKSENEKHADVGDHANDRCRVDASELRCRMVAEGGNLGVTQLGRVEYALHGGLINTDFIDNTAGVDCSDHEVNIKIGLSKVKDAGLISSEQRNVMLEGMTDAVSEMVLAHNLNQNMVLSLISNYSSHHVDAFMHFIDSCSADGELDPELEFLPAKDVVQSRLAKEQQPLTRPELSVLLSYSKIILNNKIIDSNLVNDETFLSLVINLFPRECREQFPDQFNHHPLAKEILAMLISNKLVDILGVTFTHRMVIVAGFDIEKIVRAFLCTVLIFDLDKWRQTIIDARSSLGVDLSLDLLYDMGRMARKSVRWFVNENIQLDDPYSVVKKYRGAVDLNPKIWEFLPDFPKERCQLIINRINGVLDEHEAYSLAALVHWPQSLEIISRSSERHLDVERALVIYFTCGQVLSINWLRMALLQLKSGSRWDSFERENLDRRLDSCLGSLMMLIYNSYTIFDSDQFDYNEIIDRWLEDKEDNFKSWHRSVSEVKSSKSISYTMVSSVVRTLESVVSELQKELQ